MDFSAAYSNNAGGPGFGAATKGKAPQGPLEPVTGIVHKTQICELKIPHGTPRAPSIRSYLSTYCVNPDTHVRIWVWRKGINWTTIALDTNETVHKLTATPYQAVVLTRRHLQACPDVSTITWHDWNGNILTDEMIDNLDFDPLPGQGAPPAMPPAAMLGSSATSLIAPTFNNAHALANPPGAPPSLPASLTTPPAPQARTTRATCTICHWP